MNNKDMLTHLDSLKGFWSHKVKYDKTEDEREYAREQLNDINGKIESLNARCEE
jgi:hypothetical protein